MKKENIQKYIDAFKKAEEAAIAADPIEDGGTCNFDSVIIALGRSTEEQRKAISEGSGINVSDPISSGLWSGMCYVSFTHYGQGNRRTRMVEAAHKSLKESGIEGSTVYYQMD